MYIKSGFTLIKKNIFSYVSSRGFFWTLSFGWMMEPLIYMLLWVVAVGDGNIQSFSKESFILYYIVLIFVNQLTYPTSHWIVGDNIYNGTFSQWLIRPLPPIYEAISADIAVKVVCLPFVFIFVILLSIIFKISFSFDVINILLFLLSLIFSQILRFMFSYTLALMALFVSRIDALLRINNTLIFLLAGQVIPTMLLPNLIKKIAYIFPFRYMLGFPIEVLTGGLKIDSIVFGLVMQSIYIIVIILFCKIIWKYGLKRYTAVGI